MRGKPPAGFPSPCAPWQLAQAATPLAAPLAAIFCPASADPEEGAAPAATGSAPALPAGAVAAAPDLTAPDEPASFCGLPACMQPDSVNAAPSAASSLVCVFMHAPWGRGI